MDARRSALILLSLFALVILVQVQGQGECFAFIVTLYRPQ